jgi:hypothetical protein
MTRVFQLDGASYDADALSAEGKALLERLQFTHLQMQALSNQQALLNKAKNAYIADLKSEIVQGRTGIDLSALFSED